MRKVMAALLMLAASVATADAAPKNKGPLWVGSWCLTESIYNGREPDTNEPIPRTLKFQRATIANCPADERFTFNRYSLDGLEFSVGQGFLQVEGWPSSR